jgi:molybdopterin/thiamine biosynthesis adenylyltransferase
MIPAAKGFVWKRDGDELLIVLDPRECLTITDADGQVETLLTLLKEGTRTTAELAAALGDPVSQADIAAAVDLLDSHRLVEAAGRPRQFTDAERERYFSNLAFFDAFADLSRGPEDFQRQLRDKHVLVLGTGGLNSNTIPHLCGLGVGTLTLLDRDRVEARNFARQYLYRWSQVGEPKARAAADWVRGFDPTVKVSARQFDLDGPEPVAALLDEYRPDVVMDGVDTPTGVDLWVNDACLAAGVPMVRAGMAVTTGTVWSVDPGNGACRHCLFVDRDAGESAEQLAAADPDDRLAHSINELYMTIPRTNRGIGPVAGLLGSLAAFEVLRYLTGFEPPAYAGASLHIDFARGCATTRRAWPRHPRCPACSGPPDPAAAGQAGGTDTGNERRR